MSKKRTLTDEEIQKMLATITESEDGELSETDEDEYVPDVADASTDSDRDSIKDNEDLEIDEHAATASHVSGE